MSRRREEQDLARVLALSKGDSDKRAMSPERGHASPQRKSPRRGAATPPREASPARRSTRSSPMRQPTMVADDVFCVSGEGGANAVSPVRASARTARARTADAMKIGSDVFTSEPSPKKTPKKRGAKATPEPKRRPKKGARTDEEVVADEGHPGSGAEDQADVDQPEHVGGEAHDAEPTASAEPAPPHDSTPDEQNTTERNTAESMDHATQEAADQNEVAAMVHPPVQPAAPPPEDSERDARKRLFGKRTYPLSPSAPVAPEPPFADEHDEPDPRPEADLAHSPVAREPAAATAAQAAVRRAEAQKSRNGIRRRGRGARARDRLRERGVLVMH